MPGFDRNQETIIAQQALAKAVADYMAVPCKAIADQTALMNELLRRFFKKPSIFAAVNGLEPRGKYSIIGADNVTKAYRNQGASVVGVYSIEDSDIIEIVYSGLGAPTSCFIACALSVSDPTTPLQTDNFVLLKDIGGIFSTTPNSSSESSFSGTLAVTGNVDPVTGDVNEVIDPSDVGINTDFSAGVSAVWQISGKIPCAGYKYLHLFGVVDSSDFVTELLGDTGILTIALIK